MLWSPDTRWPFGAPESDSEFQGDWETIKRYPLAAMGRLLQELASGLPEGAYGGGGELLGVPASGANIVSRAAQGSEEVADAARVSGAARAAETAAPAAAAQHVAPLFDLSHLSGPATMIDRPYVSTVARNDGLLGERGAEQLLEDATGLNFRPIQNGSRNGIDLVTIDRTNRIIWAPEVRSSAVGRFADPGNLGQRTLNWINDAATGFIARRPVSRADRAFARLLQRRIGQGYQIRPLLVQVSIPAPRTTGRLVAVVAPHP